MKYSELDEPQLIALWIEGKNKAFEELYVRNKMQVYSFIARMVKDRELAADLTQDTFFSVFSARRQFEPGRRFLSWVFGIAHKKTIDHFRRVKVMNTHRKKEENLTASREVTPDIVTDQVLMREVLAEAIEMLSPIQREVFLMREMGSISFKDIATITDCSLNTALGRMRLALKNIRKHFIERGIHGVREIGA